MRFMTRSNLCLISLTLAGLCLAPPVWGAKSAKNHTTKGSGPTYQVKSGDSLGRIAKKSGTTVAELQRLNQLSSSALKPGQNLRLPASVARQSSKSTAKPATKTGSSKPVADKTATTAAATHLVKKGESLYQIARKRGVSVEELTRLNRLTNNRLQPGQQLLLGQASQRSATPAEKLVATNSAAPSGAEEGAACPAPTEEQEPTLLSSTEADPERLAKTIGKLRDLPYRFGGNGRSGIDCSGFVQRVYREFAIDLPRSARDQYGLGAPVERNHLQQGDLVFFRTYAKYPSHVGIYLGDNKMVHASTRSRKVVISDITQAYYKKRYIGAKRLVGQAPEGFRLDNVRDLLQEETDDEGKSAGLTGRKTLSAARTAVTPG